MLRKIILSQEMFLITQFSVRYLVFDQEMKVVPWECTLKEIHTAQCSVQV